MSVSKNLADVTSSNPSLNLHRLVAGAATLGLSLSFDQLEQFTKYFIELNEWNRRVNLTSVTSWEEVQTRHFLDSLTLTLTFPYGLQDSSRLLDVGSGAGFPGLPMKVAHPNLRLALLESVGKKTTFLRHLSSVLNMKDVAVHTGRAEDLAHTSLREAFDGVVSRGVAPMNILAELTLPFCRVGGIVMAMKREDVTEELARANSAITLLGGQLQGVVPVHLEQLTVRQALVIVKKVGPTPEGYPRRPGIPAKRPL